MPAIVTRSVATPVTLPWSWSTGCAVANSPVPPSVTQLGSAASQRLAPPQGIPSAASRSRFLLGVPTARMPRPTWVVAGAAVAGAATSGAMAAAPFVSQVRRVGRRAAAMQHRWKP